jgi:predicted TPR repeat methyltransferase
VAVAACLAAWCCHWAWPLAMAAEEARSIAGLNTDPASNKKLYDEWAPKYEADVRAWGYDAPEQVAALLAKHTPDRATGAVLDTGCGDGLSGVALQAAGFVGGITGADLSPELLAIAETRGCYSATAELDLSRPLPFEDDSFIACTCVGTLTYLDPGSGILAEFCRVVRPGGLVCFTHRTDKLELWRPVQARMCEAMTWEEIETTEPMDYLPNHPEYGPQGIQMVLHVYRAC